MTDVVDRLIQLVQLLIIIGAIWLFGLAIAPILDRVRPAHQGRKEKHDHFEFNVELDFMMAFAAIVLLIISQGSSQFLGFLGKPPVPLADWLVFGMTAFVIVGCMVFTYAYDRWSGRK